MSEVKVERKGAILVISLDRPQSHNSITIESWSNLLLALREGERDEAIRVMILRAEGKSFSVGADTADVSSFGKCTLNELFANEFAKKSGMHCGPGGPLEHLGIGRWVLAATSIEKPWIASINGVAAGGGMALALMPHFRIGSTNAKFTTSFAKLGLGPEMGLSAMLPALVGRQMAMDLLISARVIEGDEAHQVGLLDRLVAPEDLESETYIYAEQIASMAPLAVRAVLRSSSRQWQDQIRPQIETEWRDQGILLTTEDCREGVAALLERRAPVFTGR